MKLIGLLPIRNEAWVIRFTIPALLEWCDEVIVLEHACTDGTTEILDRLPVNRLYESNAEWNEADYRQSLLDVGRMSGGTHFAMLDADEAVTANLVPTMRARAELLKPGEGLSLPWLNCWRSLDQYRNDPTPFGCGEVTAVFCDAPHLKHEPMADGYQLHTRAPRGLNLQRGCDRGGVLHLQHANWNRVTDKQAWYARKELEKWGRVRANYSAATDETKMKLSPVPMEWWPNGRDLIDLGASVNGYR